MITVEQIQKLDQKVQAAVRQIGGLKHENVSLKSKLDEYQKRIGELEVMIERFKKDQQEIENGILRALAKLDHLEDSSQEAVQQQKGNSDSPPDSPVEKAALKQVDSELDIF